MSLVIVDMQEHFRSSQDCLNAVVDLTKRTILRGEAIAILEMVGCGPTYPKLMSILEGYKNYRSKRKFTNDGSEEAIEMLRNFNANLNTIEVCGVNTCYCVAATAYGLSSKLLQTSIMVSNDNVNCMCWQGKEAADCFEMLKAEIKNGKVKGIRDANRIAN